jgi:hypothetical protein
VRLLERVAILLVSLALAIGLIAVLSGYFANHDQASVTTISHTLTSAP